MNASDNEESKKRSWPRIAAAAALVLLPILYFAPILMAGLTLAPGDGLSQNFGVRVLVGQMLRDGQWPLWNPLILAGAPLLASVYPGALYPPNWFFALFSPVTAMNLVVITTYHLALIGTSLYARRIGANRVGALIGGLAFTFGGYMIAHLGHTSRIAAAAWLPWMLLAIEHLYQRVSWRWIALGAAFIALQLLAGEPQMNLYAGLVCTAYAIFTLAGREWLQPLARWRFLAAMLVMVVCGGLLSMIQLLPERELLKMGERAGISYDYFSGFSFPPSQIPTFVFPFFFGGSYHSLFRMDFWSNADMGETCGYFGLLTVLLALAALIGRQSGKRGLIWFWFGVALVSLVLSFGGYLPFGLNYLLHGLPVYNLFRASGRHLYEFSFSFGLLAALGITAIAHADHQTAKRIFKRSALTLTVIVALTAVAYRFLSRYLIGEDKPALKLNSLADTEVLLPAGLALLSLGALWLYIKRKETGVASWLPAAFLIAVMLADLASFSVALNWHWRDFVSDVNGKLQDPPAVKLIKSRESDLNSFRIVSHSTQAHGPSYHRIDFPNLSIVRGLQSVNGYDALRLLRQSAISGDMGWDGGIPDGAVFGPEHQGFNLLNVKYLISDKVSADDPAQMTEIEGIRFSREPVATSLTPGAHLEAQASGQPVTELALVTLMANATHVPDETTVVRIRLHTKDGRIIERELQAGRDTAEWAYDKPEVKAAIKHRRPKVAESEPSDGFMSNRFLARLPFDRAEINHLEMEYALPDANLMIVRASLFDSVTGKSFPLSKGDFLFPRWRELAALDNVAVYENTQFLPRAWFVRRLQAQYTDEVLQTIKSGKLKDGSPFNPAETALFEKEDFGNRKIELPQIGDAASAEAKVTRFEPNRLEIATRNSQDGFLVLSEIYYRGWEAWIDGKRAPVEKVNYTLRGLFVPAGDHRIEFVYRAHSFRNGAMWSLLGLLLLVAGAGVGRFSHARGISLVEGAASRLRGFSKAQLLKAGGPALLVIYGAVVAAHASHAVGGSDSSGYATIARSVLEGRILLPIPELEQLGFPASYAPMFSPLAYTTRVEKSAPQKAALVPVYPVGFPLHMAAGAVILGWRNGPFIISPLMGTLSLLFLYLIGRRLGLSRAFAFAGAMVLALNPTFLFMASQPMSDVTALFWSLALVWAGLRSQDDDRWAGLAGAAFGMAFLVRPTNILLLVPLAFCLRLKPKALFYFVLGGLPLAAIFCGYNYAAYGHPLRTGYGSINLQDELGISGYSMRFKHYIYWIALTMSPVLLAGWLGAAANRLLKWRERALLIAWFSIFLIFYSSYNIYEDWWYTRFLLPGYPGLVLGACMTAQWLLGTWVKERRYVRWAAGIALLAMALSFPLHYDRKFEVLDYGKGESIHADSSRWADARVPARAVIVTSEMSGALKFYTHQLILRWDMIPPELWPSVKSRIQEKGYEFYALLMHHELEDAQRRVPGEWREQGQMRHLSLWHINPLDKAPPAIKYEQGFSGLERAGDGASWHWMSDEGVLQLENTGQPMRLRIEGNAPLDSLPRPGTFKISLNGVLLDQTTMKKNPLQKEFIISPAQQGEGKWSELRISTDQIFVPSQLNPASGDQRRLGFSLSKLTWEELSANANAPGPVLPATTGGRN
jgi:hypothetical protein